MHGLARTSFLAGFALLAGASLWSLALADNRKPVASTPTQTAGPYDPPTVGVPAGFRGFEGSYGYPTSLPPPPAGGFPWTASLKGQSITPETAGPYVQLLKAYISDDMLALLSDPRTRSAPSTWNAAQRGWYNEPWLSSIRDGVHGLYTGSTCFSPVLFPKSGLKAPFTTYVLVFYNDIAGRSLSKVWGKTALAPNFANNAAQFDEGSIVVKAAFSSVGASEWAPMANALPWTIYTESFDCTTQTQAPTPSQFDVNFFQFDIIVKDTRAAPKTGWVFSTLVFDNRLAAPEGKPTPAQTAWTRMIPLGAMWGNDPQATKPTDPLLENWINPAAPVYATETLGWGGRLSGPNDGAQQNPPYYTCSGKGCAAQAACKDPATCKKVEVGGPNLAMSSCMSCHGVSQYAMEAFLLPVPLQKITATGQPVPANVQGDLVFYQPGSKDWMQWFQSRPGTVPQKPLSARVIAAADYGMNFPFKSLQYWAREICINRKNPDKAPACNVLSQNKSLFWLDLEEDLETDYQGHKVRMR